MNNKVKYTRSEYREEYLKSDEWKNLRSLILDSNPDCQCCGQKATDVHHLVYRNIVDVRITDLLPVCRNCHDYIHDAIRDGWISQEVQDLDKIKVKTINIMNDDAYVAYAKWLSEKHLLSDEEQELICKLHGFVIQKISGLVKRNVWYDKLSFMKFTGRQIIQIRKIIETGLYRREHKTFTKHGKKYTNAKIAIAILDRNNRNYKRRVATDKNPH